MARPNIQIDNEVREMTQEEYEDLLATGWTLDEKQSALDVGAQSLTDAG